MTQSGVLTEEHRRQVLGVRFPPVVAEIEKSHIKRFAEAVGDRNPLWNDERAARKTRYGSIIAPPTFLRILPLGRPDASLDLPGSRKVDGGSEWEYFEPVRSGDRITAHRRIVDLYERAGSRGPVIFIVALTKYVNQFGDTVATQKTTSIRYDGGSDRTGATAQSVSELKVVRDTGTQDRPLNQQVFWDDLEEGTEIPHLVKRATIPDLARYAGASGDFNPIHLDKDAALQAGLPGVILHGGLKNAWLGQLVTDWIGHHGTLHKLAAQYRGTDLAGETVTYRGKIARKYVEAGVCYVDLELWTENGLGQRTTRGRATVSLPCRESPVVRI